MARRGREREESHSQLTRIDIHTAKPTGPAIAREQGGRQYAHVNVKAGSLRSSAPGHGVGRGSPQRNNN
jgi:hypothetical protein